MKRLVPPEQCADVDSLFCSRGTSLQGFDAVPSEVHRRIFSFLPLVDRGIRCALVSKRWAALLHFTEPAFWADLSFEGANADFLHDEALLGLCRRAAGQLRSLDLTACRQRDLMQLMRSVIAEGLAAKLECLSAGEKLTVETTDDVQLLVEGCPALVEAGICLNAEWLVVAAAMTKLPLTGAASRAELHLIEGPEETHGFTAVTTSLADALASCSVDTLVMDTLLYTRRDPIDYYLHLRHLFEERTAPSEVADRAATRLGAALAHPSHGARVLCDHFCQVSQVSATPVLGHMFRALTSESRLECLDLRFEHRRSQYGSDPLELEAGVALELAAAIAAGRTRLQTIAIENADLTAGDGCAVCTHHHHIDRAEALFHSVACWHVDDRTKMAWQRVASPAGDGLTLVPCRSAAGA